MSRRPHDTPKTPAEILLHRDLSTSSQINMLLPVCHTMMSYLLNPEREHENIPGKKSVSGEAFIAAENTFISACERIDMILGDTSRWGAAYQLKLEQQYNERHDQQMALLDAQKKMAEQQRASAEEVVAPHFRYKPVLVPLDDGNWAAFLGNLDDLDSGILGLGKSPDAALRSFNDAFKGNISQEVKQWLAQHEKDLESGAKTSLLFPKNEHDKKLESNRDGVTETPSHGGENCQGNSSPAGSDPNIGGA